VTAPAPDLPPPADNLGEDFLRLPGGQWSVWRGPDLLAELGPPLALVLHSGRWLAARLGADCLDRFDEYFDRKRRRLGGGPVPLADLLALATRDLYTESRVPPVAAAAIAELQAKWHRVLARRTRSVSTGASHNRPAPHDRDEPRG
jgi:hypothetical protein